jgi:hypothetical protein
MHARRAIESAHLVAELSPHSLPRHGHALALLAANDSVNLLSSKGW